MKTKTVIENLLYTTDCKEELTACHILDEDRDWQAVDHGLFFMEHFKEPSYLMIVDKLLHVYIIGKKSGRFMNVIEINGFYCNYLQMKLSELRLRIIDTLRDDIDLFLPNEYPSKIVYINQKEPTVFIKNDSSKIIGMSEWQLTNDYSVDATTYKTTLYAILSAMLK